MTLVLGFDLYLHAIRDVAYRQKPRSLAMSQALRMRAIQRFSPSCQASVANSLRDAFSVGISLSFMDALNPARRAS